MLFFFEYYETTLRQQDVVMQHLYKIQYHPSQKNALYFSFDTKTTATLSNFLIFQCCNFSITLANWLIIKLAH